MDQVTGQALLELGINPTSVPAGAVRVVNSFELVGMAQSLPEYLAKRVYGWISDLDNCPTLTYRIETEHNSLVGLVFRNFQQGNKKAHLTISTVKHVPLWHGLHESLEYAYTHGCMVITEGSKDARVLLSYGIPTAAYLGVVPTKGHLRILRRYVKKVLWVPDHDPNPAKEQVERLSQVEDEARSMMLPLYRVRLRVKDPGLLPFYPDERTRFLAEIQRLMVV